MTAKTVYRASVNDGRGTAMICRYEETTRGRVVDSEIVGTVYGVHTEAEAMAAARAEGMVR